MNQFHTEEVMHVESVLLKVKDKRAMLKFYKDAFGFEILKEEDNIFHLGPKEGKILVSLLEDINSTLSFDNKPLYHFALLLPSRQDLADFIRNYIKTRYPYVGASDHTVSEAIYIEDVEGNGIEIYVDRPSFLWKFNNGSVYMDTRPLDIHSLIKMGKEEYKGVPKDTIMGHLHLHINNMVEAEAFFVDALGFKKLLKYGNSALFVSDFAYHHHIAFNTWAKSNKEEGHNKSGLYAYTLSVPTKGKEEFIERLMKKGIVTKKDGNKTFIHDVNGTIIYLKNVD